MHALKYNCANVLAPAFALKYVRAKFSRFTIVLSSIMFLLQFGNYLVLKSKRNLQTLQRFHFLAV